MIALNAGRQASCASVTGGVRGAEAQLRYVDVGERQVTFTFGPSSFSNDFGVPRFDVGPADGATPPPELATATRGLNVSFEGASGFNPDLSPSYMGSSVLVPETSGPLREAAVTNDTGRRLSWRLMVAGSVCPTVTTNTYVWGKSPRAQVTLTFSQRAWITAEHGATYVGSPILAPVLVTGLGFSPRSTVTLRIAGQLVDTGQSDEGGRVEKGIFVPKLPPGFYELSVTDGTGRSATYRLMVTDEL